MKELVLIRHAKSSWKDSNLDDFDRPLNKRGEKMLLINSWENVKMLDI